MKTSSKKKRALVVRCEGGPFRTRMSKVLAALLDCAYQVEILIPEGKEGGCPFTYREGKPLRDFVRIHIYHATPGLPGKVKRFLYPSYVAPDIDFNLALERLLGSDDYDLVILKDSHKLDVLFNTLDRLALSGVRVMCDMYENASEQSYDNLVRFANPLTRIIASSRGIFAAIRRIESVYLKRCDRIFVVVDEMKRFLLERYPVSEDRISVVENVERLASFDGIEFSRDAYVERARDRKIVSYVGSVGAHRGIDLFLKAIRELAPTERRKAFFVIVGAQPWQKPLIRARALGLGVDADVAVIGYVPHEEAMRWIKATDIGVIPHRDTEFIRTTVPNKLFQYMAASAMVIVSDVGPLSRIAEETDCGVSFRPDSPVDFAEAIRQWLKRTEERIERGRKGRKAVEERYCWEKLSQRYLDYFDSV